MFDCKICYFYSHKNNKCDMCDEGGWFAVNNHGKKIKEIIRCQVFKKENE